MTNMNKFGSVLGLAALPAFAACETANVSDSATAYPPSDAYKFAIRMNNGSYQTLMRSTNADIHVGDRVQIDNGGVRRY